MRVIFREDQERREHEALSEDASFPDEGEGRDRSTEPDRLRTDYQRDRDKILHTKSFRRLSHKTQVFLAAEGDHFRTRLTHTLEVAQIARTIARALGLNEDLTEAISLGHDLGHTPFGHTGESALAGCLARHKGVDPASPEAEALYRHNEQSLRVVERIENGGRGLNLTPEVRDGIVNHTGDLRAETLEGRIVAVADRIAYVTTTSTTPSARASSPRPTCPPPPTPCSAPTTRRASKRWCSTWWRRRPPATTFA